MKSRWTAQQEDAIRLRGRNLLVSAAAGSGKTAVLVERIAQRLLDPTDPLEIDRILVVTFTEAAAGEMRERIGVRLERALEADPANTRLRRQMALLARASISTLHSFCLRAIRQHFHQLDLDPAIRTLTEHEARLLRQETLLQVLEDQYSQGSPSFLDLVERYGGRHDEGVQDLLLRAHALAFSQPWPESWCSRLQTPFQGLPGDSLPEIWTQPIRLAARRAVEQSLYAVSSALDLCRQPMGPLAWSATLEEERLQLLRLHQAVTQAPWNSLGPVLREWVATRAKPLSKLPDCDGSICERVKELRKGLKPPVKEFSEGVMGRTEEDLAAELRALAPVAGEIARLVQVFDRALTLAKNERGVIDFGDMERLALRLFLDPTAPIGELSPSEIALGYRRRFEEVLIDEYQDINETQDAILQLVSREGVEGPPNRFMVGDVKQSIYRFRLAEPRLFLEKYRDFTPARGANGAETTAQNARVDLNANFRSRQGVVDAVNFIFRQVMTASVGELDYNDSAQLVFGANYPLPDECGVTGGPVEFHLLDHEETAAEEEMAGTEELPIEEVEASAIKLEAAVIGARVRALVEGSSDSPPLQVWDVEHGTYRRARYRDVVVLLRAASTQAPAFVEVFRLLGIPVYARATTGYLETLEVRLVLALLQIIDNPRQDLPLATVLRSPIVGLNEVELAQIRQAAPDDDFYTAVLRMADSGLPGTPPALLGFLESLERWRNQIHDGTLSRFIETLYEDTSLPAYALGMPGGEQRRANLLALINRAGEFDQFARQGLFRFLRHIERLRESEEDLGTASSVGEGEDVVRVMTIHQSKGLEFPVVAVANLGGRFRNDSGDVLVDRELGLGPQVVDLKQRIKHPSLAHHALRERGRALGLAEEMRLLYVAVTRARERLILVGSVKSLSTRAARWLPTGNGAAEALPDALIAHASRFLDWLGPAVARHPTGFKFLSAVCGAAIPELPPADHHPSQWLLTQWKQRDATALLPVPSENDDPNWDLITRGEPLSRCLPPGFHSRLTLPPRPIYPHSEVTGIPGKRTVSEIKRLFDTDAVTADLPEAQLPAAPLPLPSFEPASSGAGVLRGTATHSVLEHLDLNGECNESALRSLLIELVRQGVLQQAEARVVSLPALLWFFSSPLGHRLRFAASTARREWMFTTALPISEVEPGLAGANHLDETIVVQGVIDCLFEDEGGIVLVDYKTDRLLDEDAATLADRHRKQMELYALAVKGVFGAPVSEGYVVYLQRNHIERVL